MGSTRLILMGFLLLVPPLRGQEPGGCPWGWVPFGAGCYGVFLQALSWRRAEAFCQRYGAGAHLASVHSDREREAVAALLASSRPDRDSREEEEEEGDEGVWIGLHRPMGSPHWSWSDGSELDFDSWLQPPSPGRDCVSLRDPTDLLTWQSDPCTHRKPFVCRATP